MIASKNFGSFSFAKNLEEGLKSAKSESKPICLIVHKAYCGACRILIPKLASCASVKKMSKDFVMVNAYNGEDPKATLYAPDGTYVPRFAIFYLQSVISSCFFKFNYINNQMFGDSKKYIFRIVFIRSDGVVLTQVTNSSILGDEYKYYYQTSEDVVKSMRLAIKLNILNKVSKS